MEREVCIRRVKAGDENTLAYIQTESWREAFREILSEEVLSKCTEFESVTEMYKMLLERQAANGYILELDGKPHCMAWWAAARDADMAGDAELICIHSLKGNWHQGYGKMMMERILDDIKSAGYPEVVLWVFDNNARAIGFYETLGFTATGRKQPSLGAVEELYSMTL